MTRRDDTPREVLGDDLWELLGQASEVPVTLEGQGAPWSALTEETREALGDDIWELLGQASEVPALSARVDSAKPQREPQPPPWRALALSLLAALVPFLVIPPIRRSAAPTPLARQGSDDDLALVRELDLAENLDLLSHPDFDLLTRWDGRTP